MRTRRRPWRGDLPARGRGAPRPLPTGVTMKTVLIVAMLGLASAAAAESPELLVAGEVEHGGFGGPDLRISSVLGEGATFVGGRGGWIIDHRFIVGGAGYGLASRIAAPAAAQPAIGSYDLSFGYGGPFIEYIIAPERLVHLSLLSLFAAGGIHYTGHGPSTPSFGSATVFVWEPGVLVEINLLRFLRFDMGANYRLVSGVDLPGLRSSDVDGLSLLFALKFGKF